MKRLTKQKKSECGHISDKDKRGRCRKCLCEAARAWRNENPDKVRENKHREKLLHPARVRVTNLRATRKRRGLPEITPRPKPEACESCGEHKKLVLDHDHATGKFRGWLCNKCNLVLGLFGDTVEKLERAALYLEGKLPCQNV